ncbi:MAG TPA: Hsp20/alpha crystallin family protein [Methyloceanibacter sp.]|jgi:HSP20 family protein
MIGMDPFDALFRLQRALETRLESDWLSSATTGIGAFPPVNLFQQGHDFVAIVELPGVKSDALTIEAKDNSLRLSGSKWVDYDEKASLHRRERVAGSFDRTITLPIRIDPDRIKAEYRDGVLALFIPRAESDKPRSIKIKL